MLKDLLSALLLPRLLPLLSRLPGLLLLLYLKSCKSSCRGAAVCCLLSIIAPWDRVGLANWKVLQGKVLLCGA